MPITTDAYSSHPPATVHRGSLLVRIAVWAIVLLVFAAGFYFVLNRKQVQKAGGRRGVSGAITVVPATAVKGDIGVWLDAIGTVTPTYTASITAQITGVVTAVHYTEGQTVNVGDPLIDIDDRQYRAILTQAQGILQRDENVLGQAKMDLERYKTAWARNAIAKQILDDQEKVVLQDEGTVKNDEGTVQYDQLQVDYCHITAPISGHVGLRPVDPGNLVQASANSTPLAVITQMQPITVIFTIPEDSLGGVLTELHEKAKLPVDIYDRSAQTKLAAGEFLALDNQIDTTTGTVKLRAIFGNEDGTLFPNQFVNSRLLLKTLQGVTLVPTSTIQQNGQTSFVYVIQDEVAHMKEIKAGVTDNGVTQVEGINPGDVLANSSFDKLQDGDKVTVQGPGGPAGAHGGHPEHAGGHHGQHAGDKSGNTAP